MRRYPLIFLTLLVFDLTAQVNFPDLSPKGNIRQRVGVTTISVTYERPAARGRRIFGELVPYKKLWRTGAGNCTKIKFDDDVLIGNKSIPAGAYAVFTIPDLLEWTVILNSDTTLYGTGGYDERNDVVRLIAKATETERYYESFTIDIDVIQDDAELTISWGETRVSFEIKTDTDKKVTKMVNEQLLSGQIKDPQVFAMGAEYYYFSNQDLTTALVLINKAIDLKMESWYYSLKVDILTKRKNYTEAIETLKLNMAYAKTNPENWTDEQRRNVLEEQELQLKELLAKSKN